MPRPNPRVEAGPPAGPPEAPRQQAAEGAWVGALPLAAVDRAAAAAPEGRPWVAGLQMEEEPQIAWLDDLQRRGGLGGPKCRLG